MEALDFLEEKQLLRFLHLKKTELSCMENPLTFVCQLRDYNLIPEEQYKVSYPCESGRAAPTTVGLPPSVNIPQQQEKPAKIKVDSFEPQ